MVTPPTVPPRPTAADRDAAVELRARQVSKRFPARRGGDPLLVLDHVDLDLRHGEFISIIGASGCGKTTLLRVMAGLEPDFTGSVELGGRPVTSPGPDKGVVFQDHRLLPWLTVADNVGFGLLNRPAADRQRVVEKYLRLVGLQNFARAYPGQLSGGMAQRAAIVRALVNKPRVLFLDEPLGALDALTRMHMQRELERVWREERVTVLMVTHDVEEAIYLSDRVVVMGSRPGRVKKIIPIPVARPRSREHPDFLAIKKELLTTFSLEAREYFSYEI
ncbi:MAG: ABC transporter ATP-binding protein [Verrucomicrobiales bacterium]|jgi:ABC-type nitrate/sulfonate/bicarbonate transport system ATPase subunit|nr:ABC transporter ATP-binding protein [Verrucomicrobiales bacterium]